MKLAQRLAVIGATATAAVFVSTSGAQAQEGDGLLSLLNVPSVTVACFPAGQVGQGNTFNGTQNVGCSQSASSTPAGGGVTGQEVVDTGFVTVDRDTAQLITATCPAGKVVTGGGYGGQDFEILQNEPTPAGNAWQVFAVNRSTTEDRNIRVRAVCVDAAS
ncbi:hypothetical protein ACWGNN_42040 [Streptomyces sp. NPDC055817]